tara:strand:- start:4302 stop:4685 length:384 start_codon:yes stop_codon:yes gene_type:complete
VECVARFLKKHSAYFEDAVGVIIEKQMRQPMKGVQWLLAIQNPETAIVVRPQDIKRQYHISMGQYEANKKAACAWAQQYLSEQPQFFSPDCVQAFHKETKQDDMADALLLVRYFLDTYVEGYTAAKF